MEEEFLLNGKTYTKSQLSQYAKKSGLSIDKYIYESGATKKESSKNYVLNGKNYDKNQLSQYAKKSGLTLDEYIYEAGVKKKEVSEPTSQEEPVESPARPVQQDTSLDTEQPTRAAASVTLGGPTEFRKIGDPFVKKTEFTKTLDKASERLGRLNQAKELVASNNLGELKRLQNEGELPPDSELIKSGVLKAPKVKAGIAKSVTFKESLSTASMDYKDPFYTIASKNPKDIAKYKAEALKADDLDVKNPYSYYSKETDDNFVDEIYGKEKLVSMKLNPEEFNGFLNKKGYKADYIKKKEMGVFDDPGYNQYETEVAKELEKKRILDLYINDVIDRDLKRKEYNKEISKLKDIDTGAYKINEEELKTSFDKDQYLDYVDQSMPTLSKKLKDADARNKQRLQDIYDGKTEGWSGVGYGLTESAGSTWNGFIDRINQVATAVSGEEGAERLRQLQSQRELERTDTRSVGYTQGKSLNFLGTEYLVDESGNIYDKKLKIRITDTFEQEAANKLRDLAKKEGKDDWIFSPQGAAIQLGGVVGDMVVQIAATRGIGVTAQGAVGLAEGALPASRLIKGISDYRKLAPLSDIGLKQGVGDAIISQSALGYSSGMETTLKEAKNAGFNDAESQKLANIAAKEMAALYALTAPLSPQTKATSAIFGAEANTLVRNAIEQYKKIGVEGFKNTFKRAGEKLAKGAVEFVEEGGKETIQENIQQAGEIYLINKDINEEAKKELLKADYTASDIVNTSILSFMSAGMMSQMKMPSLFKDTDLDNLRSLKTMSENTTEFNNALRILVDKGNFSKDEAEALKKDVEVYRRGINKVPKDIKKDVAFSVMRNVDELSVLEDKKKGLDPAFYSDIDDQIKSKREEIQTKISYSNLNDKQKNTLLTEAKNELGEDSSKETILNRAVEIFKESKGTVVEEVTVETPVVAEEVVTAETPKDYKVYFDQDVDSMTVEENNGEFLIGNYTPASEGNNPSMKPVTDLEGNPLTFKTKEEAQAKLDEVQTKPVEVKPAEALKDVKSTAKALEGNLENMPLSFYYDAKNPSEVSEVYHKAKAEGNNPELVKAVEELLAPKVKAEVKPTETKVEADLTEVTPEATATEEIAQSEIETTLDEVITPASNNVKEQISRAKKAISKLLPNVEIIYHDTSESFKAVVGDNSRGYYDPNTKKIHINGSNADKTTVAHEVFHAVVLKYISSDKQATDLTNRMFKALTKSLKSNPKLASDIDEFVKKYYLNEKNVWSEEKLAEIIGYLASEYDSLPTPSKNIIKRWLEKIAVMLNMKPFTDNQVIDFMNTLAERVREGQEITETDVKIVSKNKKVSDKIVEMNNRFQPNFIDPISKIEFVYDKNTDEFKQLEKDGYITKDKSIKDFNGKIIFLHQPDAAFSGLIYKNGELLVEGKGGVYYPIKFHKDGYFWASTSTTAKKMAEDLNKVYEDNDGQILMALTNAKYDKLLSSTTAANGVMEIMLSKAFDKNFAINKEQIKKSLINAANNIQIINEKKVGLGLKIKKGATLEDVKSEIQKKLNPDNSSFPDRKNFSEILISNIAEIVKQNPKSIDQFGKFFSEGIKNEVFKGKTKTGKLSISAANMKQAISEMLTEPMLKEGVDRDNGGQVYAILELNGKVKAVDSDKHESYPKAIQSEDLNNKVTLNILTDRVKWNDVFEDPETGDIVTKDREKNIYPSYGVSTQGLRLNTSRLESTEQEEGVKGRRQIIGENAKLSQDVRDNLDVARNMESFKKSDKEIRLATGWERGADKKWRYEIPDNIPFLKDTVKTVGVFLSEDTDTNQLSQKANYFLPKELLDLYPQLNDITIKFDNKSDESEGSYDPTTKTIEVSIGVYPSNTVSSLIHEVQHAIQEFEGFAEGGSLSSSAKLAILSLEKKLGKRIESTTRNEMVSLKLNKKEENFRSFILNSFYKAKNQKQLLNLIDKESYSIYKKLVGEVESRNVERRMNATPEERRRNTLQSTEDVAREDQIIFFKEKNLKVKGRRQKSDEFFDKMDSVFPNDHILGGYAATDSKGKLLGRISMSRVNDDTVKIDEVVSEKKGERTGNGSAIMKIVTENADNNNVKLTLTANLILGIKAKGFETAKKLQTFYEKFGFIKASNGLMTRVPNQEGRRQISPENSSNYANMTEDGKGNFVVYHYGPRGIKSIDPKKYGSNKGSITSKPEVAAMGRVGGMAQFYTNNNFSESNVTGDKYMIKVPMDKVYDFNTDPDNLYDKAKEVFKKKNPNLPFTANDQLAYITKLAERAGYMMSVAEWNGMSRAQSTMDLKPVDTQVMDGNTITKPFNEDYESNVSKGFKPVVPVSKEEKLKEVYNKIYRERNSKNKYDDLYRLEEDFPKLSQDEITTMIEESDISKEMKDAYAEALAYEPGTRMSGRRQVDVKAIAENTKPEVDRVKALPISAEDGATFNLDGTKYDGVGLVVPMKSLEGNTTQEKLSPEMIGNFTKENEENISDESMVKMGIYKFPDKVDVSVDINIVIPNENRDVALEFGRLIGQKSLFDLSTFEYVETGADGLNPMDLTAEQFREAASALKNGVMPAFVSGRRQAPVSPLDTAVQTAKQRGFDDKKIIEYLITKGYTRKQASLAILRYNSVTSVALRKKDQVFTTEGRNRVFAFLDSIKRRALSAKSFLPKSAFLLQEKREAYIEAEVKNSSYLVRDYEKLIKNYDGDVDALTVELDKYMRGDNTAVIPDNFKAVIGKIRMHIDNISNMLISSGAVTADQADTIRKNLGQYINRSYEVFDNNNWKDKVTEEMKEAVRTELRNIFKTNVGRVTDKDESFDASFTYRIEQEANKTGMDIDLVIEKFINNQIDDLLKGKSAETFLGVGKVGSKDTSIMKEKTDIPLSIRQLMGEYTDIAQNYSRTILKLATYAENAKYLKAVRDAGMGVYFYNEGDLNKPAEFNVKIAGDNSKTMNPLNGLYTTKEIAKAFETTPGIGDLLEIKFGVNAKYAYEYYMKAVSTVKWLKTIASVGTHAKNILGNVWFMLSNGYIDPRKYSSAFSVLANSNNEDLRAKLDEYIRAGIVNQSATLNEVRAMFSDANFETAVDRKTKKNVLNIVKAGFKGFGGFLNRAYQAEDDFFKIVAYETEKSRYAKAFHDTTYDNLSADQKESLNDYSAEIVKNVLPNYGRVPNAVKFLRIVPVAGTFISFQAEAYRTAWNTVALAADELKSSNKSVKAIGAIRLSGIVAAQAFKFGLMTFLGKALMGGDDDEDKLGGYVRRFVAPWSKDSDLVVVKYGNGKMVYIDFSASDPHGGIKKAVNAAMSGEDIGDAFAKSVGVVVEPFVKEDIFKELITDIMDNKNAYGGKLYNEQDSNVNKINAIMARVYKTFEPGSMSSVRKIFGSEDKGNEALGQLTGYKNNTVDVNMQLGFKMSDLKRQVDDAKMPYNAAFRKYENGKITYEEYEAAYTQANIATKAIYSEMYENLKAASFFGVDDENLTKTMKDSRLSNKLINSLYYGELPDIVEKETASE